jgi:hypothetical protein
VPIGLTWTCLALLAASDPVELPTVSTDRPDATNGTFTVAPGVWQLEAGMDVVPFGRLGDPEGPPLAMPMTLRIGVTERIELRTFDGDPLPWLDARGRAGEGLSLGAKVRLLDVIPGRRRPSLGLQPYVSLPSFHPQTWPSAELGVIGLWTQPLTRWLLFDVNASIEVGAPARRQRTFGSLLSMSLLVEKFARVVPYAETYALVDWRDHDGTVLAVDAGVVILASRRLSFDLAARADVVATQPEYGLLGGISVILTDGVRWRSRYGRGGVHGGAPKT